MENPKPIKHKPKVKKLNKNSIWSWPIKVLFLSLALSMFFGVSSELLLSNTGIIISLLIIIVFITISVTTDMIGVAVTSCNIQPFRAMASKKVRGAKEAIALIKRADIVSSICNDVTGDICGILSGAAGATIIIKLTSVSFNPALTIIIASLISSTIAGLTIFGKAIGKNYSIRNCNKIVLLVGKFLSLFVPKGKKQNAKPKQEQMQVEQNLKKED